MWFTPMVVALVQVGQVAGTVREDSTLIPLPSIAVQVEELGRTAITDRRGNFILQEVPQGRWTVVASAIGYETARAEVVVLTDGSATVDFLLAPAPIVLSGINVEVVRIPSVGPPAVTVDMQTLAQVPALAEVDVLRALAVLPSIASVSEYSTALYVRGGTPDQTDILLDGFPVFNPYHLGGLYAAFSPDAVSSVEVVSGAVPAARGSRISGLVTVETREGGSDRIRGRGTLSLASLGGTVDGPVPRLPGTFLVSARQSLRNFAGGGVAAEGLIPRNLDVGFHDLLAKWTLPWTGGAVEGLYFSTTERVHLPQDGQGSVLSPALRHDWGWGSRLAGLSAHLPLGSSTRLEARVGASMFDTEIGTWWQVLDRRTEYAARASASMTDHIASLSMITAGSALGLRHELELGGEARRSSMDYESVSGDDAPAGLWNEHVPRFEEAFQQDVLQFWAEDRVTFGSGRLGFRVGVRGTAPEGLAVALQPRVGLRLALTDWLALNAGAGRYVQPVHSVRVEEAVGTSFMAFDLFRPARPEQGMPTAEDVAVGTELRRGDASVRLDLYTKRYTRLVLTGLPANPWDSPVVELDSFHVGRGTARGAELLADYVREPVGVWLSYAWQRTRRTVDGVTYAPRYEREHTVDLLAVFALPDNLRLNVRGIYATGQPTSPVVARYQPPRYAPHLDGFDVRAERRLLLGPHNSIRLPEYMRVDIGARLDIQREVFGRPGDFSFFVQLLNALNITNTLYWDPSIDVRIEDDPMWQFPPTLTAGVEWRIR
jgi:hypothetical protein